MRKGGIKFAAKYRVVTFNISCAILARIQFFKHQKHRNVSMKINLSFAPSNTSTELNIYSCYNKIQEVKAAKTTKTTKKSTPAAAPAKSEKVLVNNHWSEDVMEAFSHAVASRHFKGDVGETFALTLVNGQSAIILGLGDRSKLTKEILRRQVAHIYKAISSRYEDATLHLDGFLMKDDTEDL